MCPPFICGDNLTLPEAFDAAWLIEA